MSIFLYVLNIYYFFVFKKTKSWIYLLLALFTIYYFKFSQYHFTASLSPSFMENFG